MRYFVRTRSRKSLFFFEGCIRSLLAETLEDYMVLWNWGCDEIVLQLWGTSDMNGIPFVEKISLFGMGTVLDLQNVSLRFQIF